MNLTAAPEEAQTKEEIAEGPGAALPEESEEPKAPETPTESAKKGAFWGLFGRRRKKGKGEKAAPVDDIKEENAAPEAVAPGEGESMPEAAEIAAVEAEEKTAPEAIAPEEGESASEAVEIAAVEAQEKTAPEAVVPEEGESAADLAESAAGEGTPPEKDKPKEPKKSFAESFVAAVSVGAAAAGKCSKAVLRGLAAFLSDLGEGVCGVIAGMAKGVAGGVKRGAIASKNAVKTTGKNTAKGAAGLLGGIGACGWEVLSRAMGLVFRAVGGVLKKVFGAVFGWLKRKFNQPLWDLKAFLLTPIAYAWGGIENAAIRFTKAKEKGFFSAVGSIIGTIWRFFGAIIEIIRFGFNYIAPAVCILFLVALIRYASTLQYAISVTYNGSDIGAIENEATYNEAMSLVQDKVTFTENDKPILVTPKFSVTVMNMPESEKQTVDDIDSLSETMIEQGDVQIVYAYGLYINDELFGVYSEEDMQKIREALDEKLNAYSTVNAVDVFFEDDIYFSEGRYIGDVLVPPDEALDLITGGTEVEAYYTVVRGDTISEICESLGITREEFERDNPELAEGVHRGDIVTYHYTEPYLNVLTTYYEAYEQVIERTTEYEETSRREQYCEILLQQGSDGYENVTALVTLTNGKETGREIVSRTILEEMVPRKFRVGTKPNTFLDGDTEIIDTLGTFCWPVARDSSCYISTLPGWRSWDHSNHMALDIAGIPRGTPIYAACDGKVTFAGEYAAYGKLVIVDCGHGYECYYGHCSKLLVTEGDRVEKGDTIAEVGMTGSASGNHLHFEMRHYGDRINPLYALGGVGGHEIRQ